MSIKRKPNRKYLKFWNPPPAQIKKMSEDVVDMYLQQTLALIRLIGFTDGRTVAQAELFQCTK